MSKKEQDDGPMGDPDAWMATFADLVTLMITFFVMLLSMADMDAADVDDAFGDAAEDMMVEESVRGGAPKLIEGSKHDHKRGMIDGGHRPSPLHAPQGGAQKGPSIATPSAAPEEDVSDVLEDIVSHLKGKATQEIVKGRVGEGVRERFEALITLLNNPDYKGIFRLVMDRDRLRIHFAGDLIFLPGRVRIKPSSLVLLREIGRLLRGNGVHTRIIGVVQPDGSSPPLRKDLYPSQWDLAIARGCNVVRYLGDSGSVPPSQMGCVAHLFEEGIHKKGDAVVFELRSEPHRVK